MIGVAFGAHGSLEAAPIAAQPGQTVPPESRSTGTISAIASQLELARFADMVAERLKLNLEYDPASLTGSVNIRTEEGLSDRELWHLFNGVLATRGLTTVLDPAQRTYRIVKVADAVGVAPIQSSVRPNQDDATRFGAAPGAGFVTVVLRTVHRPAKDLRLHPGQHPARTRLRGSEVHLDP